MKFIDKQLAIKLKEKGFDKPCFGYYHPETPTGMTDGELVLNRYSCRGGTYKETLGRHIDFQPREGFVEYINSNIAYAPTIEQVLEWLREEKNVHIGIMPYFTMSTKNNIMWQWEILLVGKIIECENTLYVDKDYNYTKLASADCYSSYDDTCIDVIEFVVNNLI